MNFRISSMTLAAVAAAVTASSALAAPPGPPPACGAGDISGGTFLACSGYFEGNYISGNADRMAFASGQLDGLGLPDTGGVWLEKLSGFEGTSTIDFATPLAGIVYIGIHKGGAGEGKQGTAWYKLDVGPGPVDALTYNLGGLSNAALYATAPVPEPETYALMLAGISVLGFIARRRQTR